MKGLFLATIPLLLSGCTFNVPYVSSMNFEAQSMEYVGPVQTQTQQDYLFCVIPLGVRPPLNDSLAAAVGRMGADTAINVLAEREEGIGFLGLDCWRTIRLSGIAVKFKPSAISSPAAPLPH